MTALYGMSSWLLLFATIVVTVALTLAGRILVRRSFPRWDFVQHNDVAGFIISVVGTLYAVSLAFVTGIVWQEYDVSQARVGVEAAAAADVWHLAEGLPAPLRGRTRAQMARYAHVMVDREWPAMRDGRTSPEAEGILTDTLTEVARFRPADPGAANVQNEVLRHLAEMHDARRARLYDNNAGISPFQWLVLVIGALVVIGLCYLFGMANERVLRVIICAVGVMIVASWVLVFELDYPFRSDLGVTPDPWTAFLVRLQSP